MKATGPLTDEEIEGVAGVLRLAGDAGRLKILMALDGKGDLNGVALVGLVGASQALLSWRLKSLRKADLITGVRTGKSKLFSLTDKGRLLVSAVKSLGRGPRP